MTLAESVPLEASNSGLVIFGIVFLALGLLGLWQGWVAYTEPTPRFVLNYRGWSCPPLAMPYGGGFNICLSTFALKSFLPQPSVGAIGIVCLFCGLTFLMGFFFWFPPFLVPRWYHRARKAGVPRHDINAMAAFKALPVDQQKQAATQQNRHDHGSVRETV